MSKFHFETAHKTDNIILQGSVKTRNRCCGQYMHCFVGNLFRWKSAKNYKIRLRFHKAISIYYQTIGNVQFFGSTLYTTGVLFGLCDWLQT